MSLISSSSSSGDLEDRVDSGYIPDAISTIQTVQALERASSSSSLSSHVEDNRRTGRGDTRGRTEDAVAVGNIRQLEMMNPLSRYLYLSWLQRGPTMLSLFIWFSANVSLFVWSFERYRVDVEGYYDVLSYGVCFAKAASYLIRLNAALSLLFVCRRFWTFMRGLSLVMRHIVDKLDAFHRWVNWTLFIAAAVHVGAHFYNFSVMDDTDTNALNALIGEDFDDEDDHTYSALLFQTLPGLTGFLLLIVSVIIIVGVLIRRYYYKVFLYSHLVGYLSFYSLILAHGQAEWIEDAQIQWWLIGPGAIFIFFEIGGAWIRRIQHPHVIGINQLSEDVIRLEIEKPAHFNYLPGQYVSLNFPRSAIWEWHPYSITSSPNQNTLICHIKSVGDWSNDLRDQAGRQPIIFVDGPFGAPAQHFVSYRYIVLIGGGIGITPFISILRALQDWWNNHNTQVFGGKTPRVEKVYFYWMVRSYEAVEWFSDILESVLTEGDLKDHLELHHFVTRGNDDDSKMKNPRITSVAEDAKRFTQQIASSEAASSSSGTQSISTLPMHADTTIDQSNDQVKRAVLGDYRSFGRPDFLFILHSVVKKHPRSRVAVFFCGPRVVAKILNNLCSEVTASGQARFDFIKEIFIK